MGRSRGPLTGAVDVVGPAASGPALEVRGLTVEFDTEAGVAEVVRQVDLTLERGQTLGVVGESGSGKTVTALSILGLIRRPSGRITSGSVLLGDRDLLTLSRDELRDVRGKDVSMIFQEPRRSLDPAFKVGAQIAEVARRHLRLSRRDAWRRAVEMLDLVQIPHASARAHEYPHSFSGGMCQRVMLALALVGEPQVLIADEPTTALDVTVQSQVLALLESLQEQLGLAIMFITHDLGVVAEICDRVSVMYAGQVVEDAPVAELFQDPKHPYTEGLLASLPQAQVDARRLGAIPGVVPAAHSWPAGCRFNPRCRYAIDACRAEMPELDPVALDHHARCVRAAELTLRGVG
jgi:peptide/nickel transport system ATP-binding protein